MLRIFRVPEKNMAAFDFIHVNVRHDKDIINLSAKPNVI